MDSTWAEHLCLGPRSYPEPSDGQDELRSFPNDGAAKIPLWGRFYGAQVALLVTTPPATAGDPRDMGSIPGLERATGVCSCLGNPMERGAWRATVHVLQRVRHR